MIITAKKNGIEHGLEIVDGILNLKLSAMGTLTLASLLLLFGGMIKRVPAFQRFAFRPLFGWVFLLQFLIYLGS